VNEGRGIRSWKRPEEDADAGILHSAPQRLGAEEWLPVLVYPAAISARGDLAGEMERVFARNGWPPQWRDRAYRFHHYHSITPEVLGFAGGRGRLMLGGEDGAGWRCGPGMWPCFRLELGTACWNPRTISWSWVGTRRERTGHLPQRSRCRGDPAHGLDSIGPGAGSRRPAVEPVGQPRKLW